jgi:hypothetical protein
VTGLFDDIIGHEGVIELLEAELTRPAQAYLFVGPIVSKGDGPQVRRRLLGVSTTPRQASALAVSSDLRVLEPRATSSVDQARRWWPVPR